MTVKQLAQLPIVGERLAAIVVGKGIDRHGAVPVGTVDEKTASYLQINLRENVRQ